MIHPVTSSGIEVVITGLTRNRVGRFPGRPRKPLILRASSAFLHFFKTEYLRFFYALSTISTLGSQSAGNPQSLENTAWRCIEVVVTRLTRNRVGRFPGRPRKPLILRASSAFLHFFKTEYLRFFYALSTISTLGSQSAGNPQSLENTAWRCIEVVVTRLTRNQLTGQTVRGFESLHLRQSLQW